MIGAGSRLEEYLFADSREEEFAYAVLDGASIPDLLDRLYTPQPPAFECLYRGELEPDIAEVAPYLVRLDRGSDFTNWVLQHGWGRHWGVFLRVAADLDAMRHHLRRFAIVHDPDGKPLLFRYYDPRVLRVYLPTCNTEELKTVFGPILEYFVEDEDPQTTLRFRCDSGALTMDRLPISHSIT